MQEDLLKIINHYGVMKQLKYFQSEVFELNEAIITREIDYNSLDATEKIIEIDKQHIAEEIADVLVMLNQFKEYYHIDKDYINRIANTKIIRQLERIDEENKQLLEAKTNNIINELEKWTWYYQDQVIKDKGQYAQDMLNQSYYEGKIDGIQGIIDKLKELKSKEE